MLALLLAASFQIGPFYEQRPEDDYYALRPFWSHEKGETDVLWPVFTYHKDWWRFCYLVNYQDYHDEADGYQFSIVPFWFNGRDAESGSYAGLFPVAGYHPHVGMMYDFKFGLWPLWHQYRMPRVYRDKSSGEERREWLETNSVLFPFFSWRSDGAWSFWPVYGVNYQRESDHRYFLWPIVTWASYREDRDTAGAGYSWMLWPLYGNVTRERESEHLILPPLFSYAKTFRRDENGEPGPTISARLRCPWPFFEYETSPSRRRISVWPFYEKSEDLDYRKGEASSSVTRLGWKLVELYDDETRVFPFWAGSDDHKRAWPFWESERDTGPDGAAHNRVLAFFPIRWVPAVDRNWSKFWTFYESRELTRYTEHSLFWGIIRWRTEK